MSLLSSPRSSTGSDQELRSDSASSGSDSELRSVSGISTGATTPGTTPGSSNAGSIDALKSTELIQENTPSPSSLQAELDRESVYGEHLPPVPKTDDVKPLSIDNGTPDAWVARHERLIRLTGKHPLNVEPPLVDILKTGFLTPQSLFYVRSHGAVPYVSEGDAKDWKLRIHGLVEKEINFTIEELKEKFETVTLPVTLVCAGNRRKEQNMVTKGLGFNWGAAGVSTGLFTGVYLADLLDYCKPIRPAGAFPYDRKMPGRARHVIFEGIDELPKGKYGTSQRLTWVKDKSKGMLIAWGMNGEPLSPDHGFPLRLIVPGQIGGRMVKWLNRIEVSDEESQHYLHFWDNKVLPTQVTADQARSEEHWWKDPKYIINDLNVNAAALTPDHNSTLDISHAGPSSYRICGYAYTGGGKRIHRVEVSLDDGKSWELSQIDVPEDKYRVAPIRNHPFFGTLDLTETEMSFAWCFWELNVDTSRLKESSVISIRATDEGLAAMPRDMYWNATSMMNNWWFRVAIHRDDDRQQLRFEHPTLAGNAPGGWMQRMNDKGANPRYPQFGADAAQSNEGSTQKVVPAKIDIEEVMTHVDKRMTVVTKAQVAEHANETSPWFVVGDHVYDGTAFLEKHPGGSESITLVAGEDATEDFMAIHSMDAKKQMRDYHIGRIEAGGLVKTEGPIEDDPTAPFLNAKQWKKSVLVEKDVISHDSAIYHFAMDRPDQRVGLPTGQHVYLRLRDKDGQIVRGSAAEGELVQRAYTPFSSDDLQGSLQILIKTYKPSPDGKTPGGRFTTLLEQMIPGEDTIEMKGPLGHLKYQPGGVIQLHGHEHHHLKRVAMIAGGSGITPIWSTLKALLSDPDAAHVEIAILDANRMEADILARVHLDKALAASGRTNVRLWHVLSDPNVSPEWKMGKGRLTKELLEQHLFPPPPADISADKLDDTLVLLCGPPPMEAAVVDHLKAIGWPARTIVQF
ncbi:nitrate reductase [Ceraceosorus bombacis]|uniref:Nitrate reductase [NADPH] n=1 Tax=Ceraceosorus bombacis TaxID=401625 RepID=A0A0P1BC84_9BASI|nr:nitrate reductase [Ceraceosorus bombacis]